MLLQVLWVYSFFLLNRIPLYTYIRVCLSINLLMYIWVVSSFWLLQKAALNCQYLYGHICFLFSWVDTLRFFLTFNGASLVAQWLRICLPMQGTRVQALVWEGPTCCGATKPVRHNYWARVPQLLKPTCLELHNRSHRNEKPTHHNEE